MNALKTFYFPYKDHILSSIKVCSEKNEHKLSNIHYSILERRRDVRLIKPFTHAGTLSATSESTECNISCTSVEPHNSPVYKISMLGSGHKT